MLGSLNYDTFAARVNEVFTATHGPASIELTLTECNRLGHGDGFSRVCDIKVVVKQRGSPSNPQIGRCCRNNGGPERRWRRASSRTFPIVCSGKRLRFCSLPR